MWFFSSQRTEAQSNTRMLTQFANNLKALLAEIDQKELASDQEKEIFERVTKILTPTEFKVWDEVYHAEMLMASIMPWHKLRDCLDRQIRYLKRVRPALHDHYLARLTEIPKMPGDSTPSENVVLAHRSLLQSVLDDVHWAFAQRYENRRKLDDYTGQLTVSALAVAVAFLIVLVCFSWLEAVMGNYAGLGLAVVAGVVGSTFSVLTSPMPSPDVISLEEMRRVTRNIVNFLRLTVGGLAATILYFFFESGVLGGELLPSLDELGFAARSVPDEICALMAQTARDLGTLAAEDIAVAWENPEVCARLAHAAATGPAVQNDLAAFVPNADLSKLLVWSFAAGFSEKLVRSLLGRVNENVTKNSPD